jgi:hypothetical protein
MIATAMIFPQAGLRRVLFFARSDPTPCPLDELVF